MCQKTSLLGIISFLNSFVMGLVAVGVVIICLGELIVIWIKEVKSDKDDQNP